jgi:hypothetical protein
LDGELGVREPNSFSDGGEFQAPMLDPAVPTVTAFVHDRDRLPGQPEQLGV